MDDAGCMSDNLEKCKDNEGKDGRLPMFGPLSIQDVQEYYKDATEKFKKLYDNKSQNNVDIEDFYFVELLGEGAFGKVMLVQNKSNLLELYAMKVIEKSVLVKTKRVEHALNEKRVLQSVDFPFGVRLEHFCKDGKFLYFFMPYIAGGEVYSHLRQHGVFDQVTARFFAAQVVLGLEYLHTMKLIYRDMKPENLLLDCNGYIKITDFGFSKLVLSRTYTFCGTPQYLAPEVIKGHGYGHAIDWWGLGVLIYEMNAGYPPFSGRSNLVLFQSITKGR